MKRFLKKTWAVILVAVLILSAVPLYVFANGNNLKICVASDLHLKPLSLCGPVPVGEGDDIFYHATKQGQMNYESTAIIKSFLKAFDESEEEILLLPGDLTDGNRASHAEMVALLSQAESKGKRVYVICGNHDIEAESTENNIDYKEFRQLYGAFGYDEAVAVDEGSASYTADLNGDYRLLAVDTCYDGKDEGRIDDRLMTWIKAQAQAAAGDGKHLVAMMHHNVLPHMGGMSVLSSSFFGGSYMKVAEQLADLGIKYVFTGHIHANDITETDTKKSGKLYDIMTGSLITYPNAYRKVVFTAAEVNVKTDYVTTIDTSDLTQGYTDAQLQLLQSDFPSFSKGYFYAGIKLWIHRMIGSAQKIASVLDIEEESALYGVIDKIMSVIGKSLALPLYDEYNTPDADSIQEIAAAAGYTMPESDYNSVYEVAGDIFSAFFAGEEGFSVNDTEPSILFAALKGCISYALGQYSQMLLSADGAKLTGILAKLAYADSLPNKLFSTLVDPLLESVISDAYTPGDLNVTLEAYSVNGSDGEYGAALSLYKMISRYCDKVFDKIFS